MLFLHYIFKNPLSFSYNYFASWVILLTFALTNQYS